jgi:kynurenine 3-monooxygenase
MLARRGLQVTVYEKRADMRKTESDRGRSINLALSERGWKALRLVGMEENVRGLSIPMTGRLMHDESGRLSFQPYGVEGQAIYSVSRGGLNTALMDAAEQAGARIYFESPVLSVDVHTNDLIMGQGRRHHDVLIGADGAFSSFRLSMMTQTDRFEYSQHFLEHGYKELSIPPAEGGGWRIEKNALHIWPRHSFMLIALPNLDGSFTCTLFFPFDGALSFNALREPYDVQQLFSRFFPDALEHMPTLADDFFHNPTGSLVTVNCFPWSHGTVALIGDAAHAIVPFYGQGMNAGF